MRQARGKERVRTREGLTGRGKKLPTNTNRKKSAQITVPEEFQEGQTEPADIL